MSTSPSTVLEVRHITKRYGRVLALDDVSFEVRSGEVLGLIGPNGSGKTTLFECIAGLLYRDAGSVVSLAKPAPAGRIPFAFLVPDGIAPWPAETVRWLLDYTVGFFGGDEAAVPGIIEAFDLGPLLDVAVGHLSKGQRKRALLAVGIAMRSPLP